MPNFRSIGINNDVKIVTFIFLNNHLNHMGYLYEKKFELEVFCVEIGVELQVENTLVVLGGLWNRHTISKQKNFIYY